MSQIIHSASSTIHLIYIKHNYVHVNEVFNVNANKQICTIYIINEKEIKRLNFS